MCRSVFAALQAAASTPLEPTQAASSAPGAAGMRESSAYSRRIAVETSAAEVLGEVDNGDVDVETNAYHYTSRASVAGCESRGPLTLRSVRDKGSEVKGTSDILVGALEAHFPEEPLVFISLAGGG